MYPSMRSGSRSALALVCSLLWAGGAGAQREAPEAPFGDRVSERIPF
jgi:hypothetical protein